MVGLGYCLGCRLKHKCCMLEVRCGWAGVVSGLQAKAQLLYVGG